jgi:SAM-dependent methyltransferase
MLQQAHQFNVDYRLVQASSPQPPFAPASFDLVFCVHAFHHFPNKPQVIRAAYNILRPGGAFAIVNFDPQDKSQDWYIYTYFESVYETDLERFPTVAQQKTWLQQVGFRQVSAPVVQYINENKTGDAILSSYYIRKDSCSQLILLSDEAYQAGLARIQAAIEQAKASGKDIVFPAQLNNRMCYGFKPDNK